MILTVVPWSPLLDKIKFVNFWPEMRFQNRGWYWTFFKMVSLLPYFIVIVPEHSEVVVVPLNPVIFCLDFSSLSGHFSFVV